MSQKIAENLKLQLLLPKKGRGQRAAMLKERKIFGLPDATGFKAPKFIYEKRRKYVFRDASREARRGKLTRAHELRAIFPK
ncbi:MAG: hypothetical protein PUP92_26170 [Rhizonema sp. PD38]|nr:hypothetical protein [Rhizonema sp. PD38]